MCFRCIRSTVSACVIRTVAVAPLLRALTDRWRILPCVPTTATTPAARHVMQRYTDRWHTCTPTALLFIECCSIPFNISVTSFTCFRAEFVECGTTRCESRQSHPSWLETSTALLPSIVVRHSFSLKISQHAPESLSTHACAYFLWGPPKSFFTKASSYLQYLYFRHARPTLVCLSGWILKYKCWPNSHLNNRLWQHFSMGNAYSLLTMTFAWLNS